MAPHLNSNIPVVLLQIFLVLHWSRTVCTELTFLGQQPFQAYISLASFQGQTIYQLYAVESPAGVSNAITYSIMQNSEPPLFQVQPQTGQLKYTSGSLELTQYTLTVSATSNTQSVEANVIVTVIIESDSTPRFEQTEYTINVPENIPVDAAFSIIRAFSLNVNTIESSYRIIGGNTDSDITIESTSGLLRANRGLDRERTHSYTLIVRYISSGSGPIETAVSINVLDINDNSPQFSEPFYDISIPETIALGSYLVNISATDPDLDENGTIAYSLSTSDTSTFSLDTTTGRVMVIANLDYESQPQYYFTVTAVDGGSPPTSSIVNVQVNLLNIDDECPQFENPFFIGELQYDPDNGVIPIFGVTLVTIKAYDPDGLGAITYLIESPTISNNNVFTLNNMTGVISLSRINPSIRDLYIFNVSASDSSCIRQSIVPVEIAIGSRNSHNPQFPTECTATMYENPPIGTQVVTLNAMDEDIGVNGDITYSLITQTDLFMIDPSSGTISTVASPESYDREVQSQIYVDVIARDGGNGQDYCQLTITLLDQNDNSPHILLQRYDTTVQVGLMPGAFVIQIEATDSDSEVNGMIAYSLNSPSNENPPLFAIDPVSGNITVNGTLSVTTYTFDVTATDMGVPLQLSSTAAVSITVANDLSFPEFTQTIYSGVFAENIAQGTNVLTVAARSTRPNDPIFYEFVRGSEYRSNVNHAFTITPLTNGGANINVGSNDVINYERLQPTTSFSFFVQASNSVGSSIAGVKIFITDVDDSRPEFLSDEYSISIAENEPIGTTVLQLQAVDPDSGSNGVVNYRLFFPNDYFNVTQNGTILSNQLFDSENPTHTLNGAIVVEAFNPNNPQVQRTTQRIQWMVVDVNDNQISFVQFTYTATLAEDQAVGSVVVTLEATDPDSSDTNNLQYFIVEGNDGIFGIDSNNVTLARRLDYETVSSYTLQVQVTDGQQMGCTQCLATVNIRITDIDDESPVFTQSVYQTQLTENAPIGTFLVNISATDSDSTVVRYDLLGVAEGRFAVDSNGMITVSGQIDREEFLPDGELVFLVLAEGGGLATAEVHVTVTDLNDNTPRFTEAFQGRVQENISPGDEGISIVQVQALDLDAGENGSVTYSLNHGGEAGFRIDPNSGLITSHVEFDRETQSSYIITVQATDNGLPTQHSSTTNVTIDIGDDNDNRPYFPYLFMFARVFENAPIGTHVITLPAIDLDNGTNATITYHLLSFSPSEIKFALNSETGEISVIGSLDYEIPLHRVYTLDISISDPQFQAEAEGTLVIHLLDQNDNAPVVEGPQYTLNGFRLSETLPAEEQIIVARFNASDEDSGLNSELVFEITGGNVNEVFSISDENGVAVVRNVRQLDHETTPRYELLITVSDKGTPPRSTTVPLPFRVDDVNDEPPAFNQSSYTATVSENTGPQVSILQLNATDPDTGSGGNISAYNIESGNEGGWFILDSARGTLGTNVSFDREERLSYTLTVTAVDDGGLIGSASVLVVISDENDNPSLFGGALYIHIYALDGRAPTGPITVPNFIDPDTNNSFTACLVRFQSSGLTQLFSIDEINCQFSLNQPNPPEGVYNFGYTGRDGVYVSVSTNISVVVDHIQNTDLSVDSLVTITVNASAEEYLSERLNVSFPLLIAGAIGVDPSQLRIVSVHPGYHDPSRSVDITFTAQNSNSEYINPVLIYNQLFLERSNLIIGEYSITSLPTDPCINEPCFNQAACKSLKTVRATELVARSKEFVLLAPRIELGYECECVPGTSGRLCEINYDDCYSNPCMQDAQCIDQVGGFQCDCPDGSSGPDCSFNPDECISDPCMNGATCVNGLNTYVCDCLPGYYGRECQYTYYEQSTVCSENPCQNGAKCSPGRDNFTCVCPVGFSGRLCEMEEQARGGCLRNPCYNGSSCTDTTEGPVCKCSVGFTGPNCRFPLNNCELKPCENDGICLEGLYGSYRCLCAPGFTGENCSDLIAACDSNPCMNGGRCLDQSDGSYTCECTRYFHGVNCNIPLFPPDLCDVERCLPNATCTSGRDDFTCTCTTGFFGRDCSQEVDGSAASISPCASNPCQHGGTCNVVNRLMYSCTCSVGFTGTNCQTNINDCVTATEPCLNGGVCQDGVDGFVCNCSSVYTGRLCEVFCPDGQEGEFCETKIQYCFEESCLNGGTCVEVMGGFRCACPLGYTGTTCEVVNDCSIIECLNGGVCVEATARVYQCNCSDGFEGENCQLLTISFSGTSLSQSSYRAYDSLNVSGQGNISFEFATLERNGLLLYNTQYQGGKSVDFIAVEIVEGLLRVGVSQGDDSAFVSVMSSTVNVSDGQWHQVGIETSGQRARVLLDFCQLFEEGLLALADCSSSNSTIGNKSFLDLGLPLWLGGVPAEVSVSSNPHISSRGITGCMRRVYIGGKLLDLNSHLMEENSAPGCAAIERVCHSSGSLCGEGECVPLIGDHRCVCPPLMAGSSCENDSENLMFGGRTYAQYTLTSNLLTAFVQRKKRQVQDEDSLRSSVSEQFSLRFRTEMGDGRLFQMGSALIGDVAFIQLEGGVLIYGVNLGSGEERVSLPQSYLVTDAQWHYFEASRVAFDLTLTLDNQTFTHTLGGAHIKLDISVSHIYAGGRPTANDSITNPYVGCLQDIRVDENVLPTFGTNKFASVSFGGSEPISKQCALRGCFPNPCGTGNCTERGNTGYVCACSDGSTRVSQRCPDPVSPSRYTFIIVVACVLGMLIICSIIILLGMLWYARRKTRKYVIDERPNPNRDVFGLDGRDCLVISNDSGGGEQDTSMTTDRFQNEYSVLPTRKDTIQERESEASSNDSIAKKPLDHETTTSKLTAVLTERIDTANEELPEVDSMRDFCDEGSDSENTVLSSICSELDSDEMYTVERLREAGPEFAIFVDLFESLLEEEKDDLDSACSQVAHTGKTQDS